MCNGAPHTGISHAHDTMNASSPRGSDFPPRQSIIVDHVSTHTIRQTKNALPTSFGPFFSRVPQLRDHFSFRFHLFSENYCLHTHEMRARRTVLRIHTVPVEGTPSNWAINRRIQRKPMADCPPGAPKQMV